MAEAVDKRLRAFIVASLVVIFFALDFGLGTLLNPKVVGSRNLYYHHDMPPNFSGHRQWGGVVYPYYTNSLGFSDREVREVPLVSSRKRLLLMGDSFTEGIGLTYENTFAGILAARLEKQGVEILNAGLVHYTPKLYYLKLRYFLEKVGLKFDQLMVFIDISDIQDEIFYELFEPYDGIAQPDDSFRRRLVFFLRQHSLIYEALQRLGLRQSLDHILIGSDGTSTVLRELWKDRMQMADINWREVSADSPLYDEGFRKNYQAEKDNWTLSEDIYKRWGARGLSLAAEHMDKLHQLCRAHNIPMTIVVYPWPQQIFEHDLDSLQRRFWRDFCAQRGLQYIDLFPAFINDRPPIEIYEKYFILNDVHWAEGGHQLVADLLYPQIAP